MEEKARVGAIIRDHVQVRPEPCEPAVEGEAGLRTTTAADEAMHEFHLGLGHQAARMRLLNNTNNEIIIF